MGNERSGLLAFPVPQLSLFRIVFSLSKGIFWLGGENMEEKELCGHRAMNFIVTIDF
jgi:hypothetical protein